MVHMSAHIFQMLLWTKNPSGNNLIGLTMIAMHFVFVFFCLPFCFLDDPLIEPICQTPVQDVDKLASCCPGMNTQKILSKPYWLHVLWTILLFCNGCPCCSFIFGDIECTALFSHCNKNCLNQLANSKAEPNFGMTTHQTRFIMFSLKNHVCMEQETTCFWCRGAKLMN